jgi:hypothetical protein
MSKKISAFVVSRRAPMIDSSFDIYADERTVPVDRKFLADLMEYLHPSERFMTDSDGRGLVLYTVHSGNMAMHKKLVFVRKDLVKVHP